MKDQKQTTLRYPLSMHRILERIAAISALANEPAGIPQKVTMNDLYIEAIQDLIEKYRQKYGDILDIDILDAIRQLNRPS